VQLRAGVNALASPAASVSAIFYGLTSCAVVSCCIYLVLTSVM